MAANTFQCGNHAEESTAGPAVLQTAGAWVLRYGLVFILGLWGTAKGLRRRRTTSSPWWRIAPSCHGFTEF